MWLDKTSLCHIYYYILPHNEPDSDSLRLRIGAREDIGPMQRFHGREECAAPN